VLQCEGEGHSVSSPAGTERPVGSLPAISKTRVWQAATGSSTTSGSKTAVSHEVEFPWLTRSCTRSVSPISSAMPMRAALKEIADRDGLALNVHDGEATLRQQPNVNEAR
jgi:hypothetical protein